MSNNRRAGIIYVKVDGVQIEAKGDYSFNLGLPKREPIIGSDGVHGYKETPQVSYIEGATTDGKELDIAKLAQQDNVTVTLERNNGKTYVLHDAWFAGDATVSTGEGEINVRWESRRQGVEM